MSSFGNKGYKASRLITTKNANKGIKAILNHLETIYEVMSKSDAHVVTKENLPELAKPLMGRDLDHLEINILERKFGFIKPEDVTEDNDK